MGPVGPVSEKKFFFEVVEEAEIRRKQVILHVDNIDNKYFFGNNFFSWTHRWVQGGSSRWVRWVQWVQSVKKCFFLKLSRKPKYVGEKFILHFDNIDNQYFFDYNGRSTVGQKWSFEDQLSRNVSDFFSSFGEFFGECKSKVLHCVSKLYDGATPAVQRDQPTDNRKAQRVYHGPAAKNS